MVSNDRRQFLRVLGGIGVVGLAGCGGDGGDTATETGPSTATDTVVDTGTTATTMHSNGTTADPTTTTGTLVTEGFEDDWSDTFEDTSQADSSPALTTAHAAEGDQALDLAASSGAKTTNSVLTKTTFTAPLTAEVRIKRYESTGPNNGAGMALLATDSGRKASLSQSGSHDGVKMNVHDEAGEKIGEKIVSDTNTNDWHPTSIEITAEGTIVGSAFGDSATYDPEADWTGASFIVELQANGWNEGNDVAAAYDAVRIEESSG